MTAVAVIRLPLSRGEFIAQWPQDACAADFEIVRGTMNAVLYAWAREASKAGAIAAAGDAEYQSWFSKDVTP